MDYGSFSYEICEWRAGILVGGKEIKSKLLFNFLFFFFSGHFELVSSIISLILQDLMADCYSTWLFFVFIWNFLYILRQELIGLNFDFEIGIGLIKNRWIESFFILGTYSDILLLKPSYFKWVFFSAPYFFSWEVLLVKKLEMKTELLYQFKKLI